MLRTHPVVFLSRATICLPLGKTNNVPFILLSKHLDFKLDAKEDEIGLVQFNGKKIILIDSIHYENQLADMSFGRYPDGANAIQPLLFTPGTSNLITCINDNIGDTMNFLIYPNPASENIMVNIDIPGNFLNEIIMKIVNSSGEVIKELLYKNISTNSDILININELTNGIYYIQLLSNGTIYTSKFLKTGS